MPYVLLLVELEDNIIMPNTYIWIYNLPWLVYVHINEVNLHKLPNLLTLEVLATLFQIRVINEIKNNFLGT